MKNLIDIAGKVALITGAAHGIGLASAKILHEHGAKIVLLDVSDDGAKAASDIDPTGSSAIFLKCDVTNEANVQSVVSNVKEKFGRIDILFNNAGVTVRKTVEDLSEKEWDFVVDVGLKGTFLMSKHVIPVMAENGGGSIINTGSGWGLKGGDKAAAYCAVKGGIVNLTRAMAIDHGKQNIRVNSINPGDTATDLLASEGKQLGFNNIGEFFKDSAKGRPLERLGEPEDIAKGVLFLASDLSLWITGTALVIDGGGIA